jgi:hypothetical protein
MPFALPVPTPFLIREGSVLPLNAAITEGV